MESVIKQCGGFGLFQIRLTVIVQGSKVPLVWSMFMMAFAGAIPNWSCCRTSNTTDASYKNYTGYFEQTGSNRSPTDDYKQCSGGNITCTSYCFHDEMKTVVSEWTLICERAWIPSTITTVQMGGILIGTFSGGQVADLWGRKPVYVTSLAFLLITNMVAGFAASWQMFILLRFLIGYFSGWFIIVANTFVMEFVPTKYRSLIPAIPVWAVAAILFAVVCMILQNWRHVQFATAVCCLPFLLASRWVPESFRWLASRNKMTHAVDVIKVMAQINRHKMPDVTELYEARIQDQNRKENNTIKHLCKFQHLRKITFIFAFAWFSCAYSYYGISFGVQNLSGNLYVNMMLLSLVEVPASTVTYFLTNRFGRRWSSVFFLAFASVSAFVVSTVRLIDIDSKDKIVNSFTMACKLGLSIGWTSLIVWTSESYPTIIRSSGYGLQNAIARIGSMVAPQILLLNETVPALFIFLCGGFTIVSAFSLLFIPETRRRPLPDII